VPIDQDLTNPVSMATILIFMEYPEFSEKNLFVHISSILNSRNTKFSGMINVKIFLTIGVKKFNLLLF